jgi:hypothetical protein
MKENIMTQHEELPASVSIIFFESVPEGLHRPQISADVVGLVYQRADGVNT